MPQRCLSPSVHLRVACTAPPVHPRAALASTHLRAVDAAPLTIRTSLGSMHHLRIIGRHSPPRSRPRTGQPGTLWRAGSRARRPHACNHTWPVRACLPRKLADRLVAAACVTRAKVSTN